MKIGIYLGWGTVHPQEGGGHTFQQSLLSVLPDVTSDHEFYIFYYGDEYKDKEANIFLKSLKKCARGEEEQRDVSNPLQLKMATLRDAARQLLRASAICQPELVSGSMPNNKNHITFVSIDGGRSKNLLLRLLTKPYRWLKHKRIKKNYGSLLNKSVLDHQIDLMWFMTPGYEYVAIPYLYTIWDLQHRKQSFFPEVSVEKNQFEGREKLYNATIPRAAYVLAGNKTAQQEVINFYRVPAERVKMLELPTPVFALQQAGSGTITASPYLFYPAQFWPHKNHIVLVRALALLKQKYSLEIDLVLTGSDKGNRAFVQEQAHKFGVAQQVKFLGFVSRDELVSLYQQAFALVFPSFFGPNNIPPLEAFALGCPVICADADGMREQLGDAALFFEATREDALAGVINNLWLDIAMRDKLVALGHARATQWTSQDYVQEVIKIIDEFSLIRRCWGDQRTYLKK